jgi:hypothetical protein
MLVRIKHSKGVEKPELSIACRAIHEQASVPIQPPAAFGRSAAIGG